MSMSVNVNIDFSDRYKKIVAGNYDRYIDEALKRTIVEADSICQKEAPVKTGNLRRSIGTSHPSILKVCLTCNAKYWVNVQYGSAAHTITGNPLLAWKGDDGKMHFARKVQHPGTTANPFVTRTAKKVLGKKLIERNLEDVLRLEGIIQ